MSVSLFRREQVADVVAAVAANRVIAELEGGVLEARVVGVGRLDIVDQIGQIDQRDGDLGQQLPLGGHRTGLKDDVGDVEQAHAVVVAEQFDRVGQNRQRLFE